MILHWLTAGWRSLVANPLFSLITVASLAIGCCGALLAGSNIRQHLSFEQWAQPDAERIFLITRRMNEPEPGSPMSSFRQEGPFARRPQTMIQMPMKDAIEGRIPDLEAQARMVRGRALLQEDQDEQDRRSAAGSPPPGEVPPPFRGTIYVDAEFFRVFPLQFIDGSSDELDQPDTLVLSEARAKRLFGSQSAVGQTVEGVLGKSLRVVGVVRDAPAATHLAFESIAGMRTYEMLRAAPQGNQVQVQIQMAGPESGGSGTRQGNSNSGASSSPPRPPPMPARNEWNMFVGGIHYVKMSAGADAEAFVAAATREIQGAADIGARQTTSDMPDGVRTSQPNYAYSLVPLLDVHLGGPERTGMSSSGDITMLTTLATAAVALLGVSAFNYVTLSLARSLRRRREVAVRKVLGADRSVLVRQYLTESGLVTAIALALGFALALFLHPWFGRAIGQPETLFNLFDPVFLGASFVVFALLAVTVGAYPALYLASVRPRTGLGEGGTASPGRIGQMVTAALIGLQIAAATVLLIVAMTMTAQAAHIENRPMGFDIRNKYTVSTTCMLNEQMGPDQQMQAIRRCMTGTGEVLERTPEAGRSVRYGGALLSENISTQAFGRTAEGEEIGRAARISVDTEFLQFMGAKLLAGRFFDPNSAYDTALIEQQKMIMASMGQPFVPGAPRPPQPEKAPVIVTRAMLPLLGVDTPEEAIGMQIATKPRAQYPFEIVGVVEDWHQRPLRYEVHPIVFVPNAVQQAIIEIEGDDQVVKLRERLTSNWRELIADERASVFLNSLEDTQERIYTADFRLMRAVSGFAIVAIVVAGLGVYGLSAFEMRRRVREIGIRKALGASPVMVGSMVIGRAVLFAGGVSLLAWPVGYWLASDWLADFKYQTPLGWAVLPVASVIVMTFVALAVGLSSARAAAMRPGLALR
jgi:putative ABC transport system permease protein